MKKYAIYGAFGLAATILVIELPTILDALLSFLLAGSIPGTDYSLSPSFMFVCAVIILGVFTATSMVDHFSLDVPKPKSAKKHLKKNLPNRRYRHI